MPDIDPCCITSEQQVWKGAFCRCCGGTILFAGMTVGCDRPEPCPYCGQFHCGPHSGTSGPFNVRRFCEICGKECVEHGRCPTHGGEEA